MRFLRRRGSWGFESRDFVILFLSGVAFGWVGVHYTFLSFWVSKDCLGKDIWRFAVGFRSSAYSARRGGWDVCF